MHTDIPTQQSPGSIVVDDAGYSIPFFEIATEIGVHKKTIAIITTTFTILAIVVTLMLTPMFTAKTIFVVPTPVQGASAAQVLGNLGGIMAGGSTASLLGAGKTPDEMYLEFLKTKLIQDELIKKFDLQKRYDKNSLEKTEGELKKRTKFISLKKAGLISIEVEDEDPNFAADLANAYVSQLKEMMQNMALTESGQRREYYKNELIRAKKELDGVTDYREMKVRESVLAVMLNQLEVATLDAARESLIQVAEKAVPPEISSFPRRLLIIAVAILGGVLSSIAYVLTRLALSSIFKNPQTLKRWEVFKKAWQS